MASEKIAEIKSAFLKRINREELNLSLGLKDLGLDSLDVVEMCLDFEDKYGIQFTTDELSGLTTVGDLMNLIETKLS